MLCWFVLLRIDCFYSQTAYSSNRFLSDSPDRAGILAPDGSLVCFNPFQPFHFTGCLHSLLQRHGDVPTQTTVESEKEDCSNYDPGGAVIMMSGMISKNSFFLLHFFYTIKVNSLIDKWTPFEWLKWSGFPINISHKPVLWMKTLFAVVKETVDKTTCHVLGNTRNWGHHLCSTAWHIFIGKPISLCTH